MFYARSPPFSLYRSTIAGSLKNNSKIKNVKFVKLSEQKNENRIN